VALLGAAVPFDEHDRRRGLAPPGFVARWRDG